MAGLNKVQVIGNLGRDPEFRETSGDPVCNLNIAVTERWRDKNGDQKESTEWVRAVLWGKLAEIADKYLEKGSQVYIEGKLATREYEKDGEKKYVTEVKVQTMQMLGSKGGSDREDRSSRDDRGGRSDREERRPSRSESRGDTRSKSRSSRPEDDEIDDSIPF